MSSKSKGKKNAPPPVNKQYQYKAVSSDVCEVCRNQCARGIRYMERMLKPGAMGNGVPCILTKYKS
jgi:hypothetical protein